MDCVGRIKAPTRLMADFSLVPGRRTTGESFASPVSGTGLNKRLTFEAWMLSQAQPWGLPGQAGVATGHARAI